MKRVGLVAIVGLLAGGCASLPSVIDSLARDPSTACVSIPTPAGPAIFARVQTQAQVTARGGECIVTHGGP